MDLVEIDLAIYGSVGGRLPEKLVWSILPALKKPLPYRRPKSAIFRTIFMT